MLIAYLEGLGAAFGLEDIVPFDGEDGRDELPDIILVIDEQNGFQGLDDLFLLGFYGALPFELPTGARRPDTDASEPAAAAVA